MSATVLDMSISRDGSIAGPNAGPGNGLGDGGERLHDWFMTDEADHIEAWRGLSGTNRKVFDELMATRAWLPEHIELERMRILEGESGVTHIHYRVQS